jgi:pimeloyl-ACP methyl ester carboxylesterase
MPVHRTPDGIDLVYRSLGAGSHLLLLHGTSTDHTTWEPVQSALAEHFQLSILTRRGRCGSGDALPYVLQREFEDVATLVDALGGPVDIVGHSFGALCAMEGALTARSVRRLVLYESPLPGAFPYWPDAIRDRMMPLLNAGQQEQALRTFLEGMLGLSQQEIEALQRLPNWPDRVSYAHTIARELQALSEYSFDVARLRSFAAPTLLLLGGSSPPSRRTMADKFLTSIPDCRVVELPGQGHLAIRFAPELVVREVLKFLQA